MIHPIVKRTIAVCCTAVAGLFSVNAGADVPQSFSIYSLEETNVYDRASLNCGNIGSNKKITIGSEAPIRGSVFAGTTVTLRERASVNGDVTAGGAIVKGTNVVISGRQSPNTPTPVYTIPVLTVTPGSQNIDVPNDGRRTLAAGAYGTITVRDRATLTLSAGIYQFRSLSLGNDAHLVLNFQPGQSIEIKVANDLLFGDRVIFDYPGSPDFSKVKIYSGTYNTVKLGYDMRFAAFLSAPRAKIEISDRVNFQGAIYGKYVDVKYDIKNELQIPTGEGVIAVVKKVVNNGNGTYTVQFGYVNNGSKVVVVPVGINNYMTGLPGGNQDGGQVTTFYPGQVELAFSVVTDFAGSGAIGWVLYGGDPNHWTQVTAGVDNVVDDDIPVIPTLFKVYSNCDGTYTAVFGYSSGNDVVVSVPIGPNNTFSGATASLGQPTLFERGMHESAFKVQFDGSPLMWSLQGMQVVASSSDAVISCQPVVPVLTAVVKNSDGSVKAVFGYNNPNQIDVTRDISSTNNYFCCAGLRDEGQPTTFIEGNNPTAFSVDFFQDQIAWTLDGTTVTALKSNAVGDDFGMWKRTIVGAGVTGSMVINKSLITINASGINGTPNQDNILFFQDATSSNFDFSAKVSGAPTTAVSNAGLMLRGSPANNSACVGIFVKPNGSIVLFMRQIDGANAIEQTVGNVSSSEWIKIQRTGTAVDVLLSANGTTWTIVGSSTLSVASLLFGLALEANSVNAEASFSNVNVLFNDGNSNQIPDAVESLLSGNISGVPLRSDWTNEGTEQVVYDNYSSVSGYAHCSNVKTVYAHSEAVGQFLPIDQLVDANSAPVPVDPTCQNCIVDGGKLHKVTGTVKLFNEVSHSFPISTQLRGVPKEYLRLDHYNQVTNTWERVKIDNVTSNAVHAKVKSYSYYKLSTAYQILTANNGGALRTALATPITPGKTKVILCQGDASNPIIYQGQGNDFAAFTISENTHIIGGIPNPSSISTDVEFRNDPRKYKSVLTVRDLINDETRAQQVVLDMKVVVSGGAQKEMNTLIDGFTIKGGDNLASNWSAGGLRILGYGGHLSNVTVKNCHFEDNKGTTAGALLIANARMVEVSNCTFYNNLQEPTATATTAPKDGHFYGGSAVLLTLGGQCHAEATFKNCLFYGNIASGSTYAGTVTIFNDYAMDGSTSSSAGTGTTFFAEGIFQNCTFYGNRATNTTSTTCANTIVRKATDCDRLTIVNSIVRGSGAAPNNPRLVLNPVVANITYTNIEDNSIQATGTTTPAASNYNLNCDPGFISTTLTKDDIFGTDQTLGTKDDGLRLTLTSYCKNKGNSIASNATDVVGADILGMPRRTGNYDMGVFENYMRVLAIGDGNTLGTRGATYRAYLKELMAQNHWDIDFVGSQTYAPLYASTGDGSTDWANSMVTGNATTNSFLVTPNDLESEATQPKTMNSMLGGGTTQAAVNTYISNLLTPLDPHLILLLLGTKDIYGGRTETELFGDMSQVITGINAWKTATAKPIPQKLIISKIPDVRNTGTTENTAIRAKITGFNTGLGGTWSTLTADGTSDMQNAAYDIDATGTPTDINSCFLPQAGVQNDMYFTSAGYKVMAYEWWDKIQSLLP